MRLSTVQIYAGGLAGITNAAAEVAKTQQQITANTRVLTPSDDPVAATRILELETELSLSAQYQRNIDNVEGRLERTETEISTLELAIDRIRVLVIEAGNGALSNENRSQITVEINQRLEEIVGISNARDATGNYLFSGFKSDTPAFAQVGGSYVYQGDEGVRFEQVASGLKVASNETGKALFADITTDNNNVRVSAATTNSSSVQIASGVVADQTTFDGVFPEDYLIRFNDISNVAPPAANYTITRLPDGQLISADVPFDIATPINVNGVEVRLDGVPNPSDSFVVQSTQNENMLNTIARIGADLASFDDPDERTAFIGSALNDLSSIQANLLSGRGRIGARLNTLDAARVSQQSLDLISSDVLSDIQSLDYAEAVSRLSFQSFVLEAAQQSFVSIANLSLFNFLR